MSMTAGTAFSYKYIRKTSSGTVCEIARAVRLEVDHVTLGRLGI